MKKILKGISILILTISFIFVCGCDKKNDRVTKKKSDVEVNTNSGVIKDQTVGDLTFTNTSIVTENGITTVETTITNNSNKPKNIVTFNMHLKDRENNTIQTILGYVGGTINSKESKVISTSITGNLSDAYKIEYEINK